MFKIGLENRDFCKSLHFYIVDAGKKKKKKKKKKKNELLCWLVQLLSALRAEGSPLFFLVLRGACQRPDSELILQPSNYTAHDNLKSRISWLDWHVYLFYQWGFLRVQGTSRPPSPPPPPPPPPPLEKFMPPLGEAKWAFAPPWGRNPWKMCL